MECPGVSGEQQSDSSGTPIGHRLSSSGPIGWLAGRLLAYTLAMGMNPNPSHNFQVIPIEILSKDEVHMYIINIDNLLFTLGQVVQKWYRSYGKQNQAFKYPRNC